MAAHKTLTSLSLFGSAIEDAKLETLAKFNRLLELNLGGRVSVIWDCGMLLDFPSWKR